MRKRHPMLNACEEHGAPACPGCAEHRGVRHCCSLTQSCGPESAYRDTERTGSRGGGDRGARPARRGWTCLGGVHMIAPTGSF